MQEATGIPAGSADRAAAAQRARGVFAAALVACAAVVLLLRLPGALRQFDDQAAQNARGGDTGRLLAAADTLDIDNDFVVASLSTLPPDARYAVLLPASADVAAKTYNIGSLTLAGLPGYLQYLLLPRRQVQPADAQYVLCYACDTSPWDKRTTWLWKNAHAVAIGKVNGP